MRMRWLAALLFAGGLAAGLGADMTAIAHVFGPEGGPPVTGARLVQERCDQTPPWQQVRQSGDGTDPYFRLETSGPGGPALCMAAGNLGDNDQTPLVAARCQGFGNAAEILELG